MPTAGRAAPASQRRRQLATNAIAASGTTPCSLQGGTGKRGRTPLLQKQIERLRQQPKTQQKVVMQMLDGVLAHASR